MFRGRSLDAAAGTSMDVNNYLKLLMNLMTIYNSEEKERDVDSVWQLYCHVLNKQAEIGGMASTVAKINSVGMKLVLEELPASAALPAVFRSMIHWNVPKSSLDVCKNSSPTSVAVPEEVFR